ncbi:MAG: hypothetical protein HGJ94_06055 [Desulfosarcina sp.]|nr:hypothetical protein [Desulfosarcina sp.]MBC2744408.1 hypothetical protein [Desulfosarcina sp.]MBC2767316.1 hypothetical protein [Desulfosarcina sp.]
MHILIINAGSSSAKFTMFKKDDLQITTDGMVERIGLNGTKNHIKNKEVYS